MLVPWTADSPSHSEHASTQAATLLPCHALNTYLSLVEYLSLNIFRRKSTSPSLSCFCFYCISHDGKIQTPGLLNQITINQNTPIINYTECDIESHHLHACWTFTDPLNEYYTNFVSLTTKFVLKYLNSYYLLTILRLHCHEL